MAVVLCTCGWAHVPHPHARCGKPVPKLPVQRPFHGPFVPVTFKDARGVERVAENLTVVEATILENQIRDCVADKRRRERETSADRKKAKAKMKLKRRRHWESLEDMDESKLATIVALDELLDSDSEKNA